MNKITRKLPFLVLLIMALPLPATAQTISGTVNWVYDGDTFKLRGKRIRVCGIDAPKHQGIHSNNSSRPTASENAVNQDRTDRFLV